MIRKSPSIKRHQAPCLSMPDRQAGVRQAANKKNTFSFIGTLVLLILSSSICLAQDKSEDKEAFFTAQKAFEDGFYTLSASLFDSFLKKFPENSLSFEAKFYLARSNFYQKLYPEAINGFNQLLKAAPADRPKDKIYYWLAEAHLKNNEPAQAYSLYESLIREYPQSSYNAQAIYSLGWCKFEQGSFAQAQGFFREFKDKFPGDILSPEVDFKIAECLYNLKDYINLKKHLESINDIPLATTDKSPGPPDSRTALLEFYLAESCFYLEDYPSAIENYNRALAIKGGEDIQNSLHLGLGWSYLKSNQYMKAREEFNKLLENSPSQKEAENAILGQAAALGADNQLNAALDTYAKLIARTEDNEIKALSLDRIADIHSESGNTEEAIKIYENILKDYPDCASCDRVYNSLGRLKFNLKEYPEAIGIFHSLLSKYPQSVNSGDARYYLGNAYYQEGDFLNSYLQLRDFVNRNPVSSLKGSALLLEGLNLKALKRYPEAGDVFRAALKEPSQDAQVLERSEFEAAECLYYSGNKEEALNKFEFLRTKYPDSEIQRLILWRLSEHYFQEEKFDICKRYLLSIIDTRPDVLLLDDSYYMLGLCYEKEEKYSEALYAYQKIQNPDRETNIRIADMYKNLDRPQEAIAYYRKSISPDKSLPAAAQFKLGEALEEANMPDAAVSEYLAIKNDQELLIKGLLRGAGILENQENWVKAMEIYKKISDFGVPESKFAQEKMSSLKKRLKNTEAK